MTDLSAPLEWQLPDGKGPAAASRREPDKVARDAFAWPTPPFASYPAPTPQTDPLPCEIVGLNDKHTTGRLTFFVPEEAVAHVQIPPARTTLPLRFDQFRALTLTTPLAPQAIAPQEPHSELLGQRSANEFRIAWNGGGEFAGRTVGHVETEHGLFLFPPVDEAGSVHRLFVPRAAYASFEVGPRIGELLVMDKRATAQQVEQAVDAQKNLRSQKLGDILLMRQVVSPDQLFEAIDRQAKMPMVRIGDALISLGMINQAQLDEALQQQQSDRSVPLGELLVRMGVVSRADLQVALSRKMGYPLVDIDAFPAEADALRKIPFAAASRLRMMPLLIRDGRLVAALDDPARRRAAVEEAEFIAQMKVVPVLAQCRKLEDVLHAAYEKIGGLQAGRFPEAEALAPIPFELTDTDKLIESLEREESQRVGSGADDDQQIEQSDNSLVRLINNMVVEAHKDGVSDIHIESYPGREKIRIRFRKDGLLRTYLELPSNYRNAMIARIKIMCDLDISEKRKPQDGKINFAKFVPQHRIELRVATIPTNGGLEDVVMRILASAKPIPLPRIGLSERNLAELQRVVERPYGMVLCVGPTGSGKTTTLHSALSHINVPERKIWTAEDPVEITQPGLRQVQVNPKIDWTFAKALRAFLRADPDVIMVGEIRDGETAQTAVEASLTGHLVLSTLHTNSAPETVTRLLDMGMDPFNFADSLLAVLAQRLVRRLCGECRTSRAASDEEIEELLADYMHGFGEADTPLARDTTRQDWLRRFGRDGRLHLHHAPGCDHCGGTGFRGRAGVHELMVVSRALRRLIQTGARAEALQETALREGMRTLRQDGIEKVWAGVTTIDEVRAISNS
ncbi:ATPase, T2SS/T4P/T4SS family [Piscinibacter sp.]|uniref:GspE/PulE family protein n=1 Tax=Piscinibacter sp. TaxID=1903157 RepID=UPI003D11ECD7